MSNYLRLRRVTDSEEADIRRLAISRAKSARLVQRARVIEALLDDPTMSAKEAGFRAGYRSEASGPKWAKRFNAEGLEGLEDRPRSGCPPTHNEAVHSALLDLALQKPESLGLPFAMWTLERLQTALQERENVHLATSTIWEYVEAEGLKWKRQESWFHEAQRHDERFAEKELLRRGPSSQLTEPSTGC